MTGLLSASPKWTSQMTVVSSGEEEQDGESLTEQYAACPTPEKSVFLEECVRALRTEP